MTSSLKRRSIFFINPFSVVYKKTYSVDIMKNMKVLLVDDEPDILEIVGYNLEMEGFQVLTAKNGVDAIKKAMKELPHLIIMDVMMPEMDGIEALRKTGCIS